MPVDDSEPFDDGRRQPVKVEAFLVWAEQLDMASDEAICLPNRVLTGCTTPTRDASRERVAIGLSRHQPEPTLAILELVDQVQLVVALDRLGIRFAAASRIAHRISIKVVSPCWSSTIR
jgi:hypothetical protein